MELTEIPNAAASMEHIFSDSEFEDDKFHAASFVAKHRRVTSLDSLRDQLRTYCGALKQQLYSIINRDYKDFITIATKVLSLLTPCNNILFSYLVVSSLFFCIGTVFVTLVCVVGWSRYACRTSSKTSRGFTP